MTSRRRARSLAIPRIIALAGAVLALGSAAAWASAGTTDEDAPPPLLQPVAARTMETDTLFVGGYARGTFTDALSTLASDLSQSEREMVGRHLDKIYLPLLREKGLAEGGRLRLAYERTLRPDGTTRSIQVLAAEAAVGGGMYTVFLYEHGEEPGYFDDLGRSLDPAVWASPLPVMRITSTFRSARMHPILHRILPHLGLDLAAAMGTPVHATGDGSISLAGPRGGYGNMVEVQHPNGYATRYGHLSRIAPGVYAGAEVRQGDVIGYVGMTGLATGPHLHYEVRRKGLPVDPQGVSPVEGPAHDVGYDPTWLTQRHQLGQLLARAPTVVSAWRQGM
ncbi:MAG TPA: M23 family metallopeptidase [Longimicrobiaceae bacterium]|jgi:murein DD-endopeptidase MepM/ murein hydrolase activator NlpD|nr:M23 family metallopeptidase [Longimicrobiaceae bacterium]